MKKFLITFTIAIFSLILASCGTDYNSSSYSDATAGQAQIVRYGVIVQTQPVTINSEGDRTVGTIAGAGAGAVLGSLIGGGAVSNALGSIGGAVAGGAAGSAAGKAAGKQNGVQYFIKLDSGNTISIVQGIEPALNVGQRVIVLSGSGARDRVMADNSSAATPQPVTQTTVSSGKPSYKPHKKTVVSSTTVNNN